MKTKTPRHSSPAKQPDFIAALAGNSAKTLGIPVDPAWRKSIAFNLALIMRHAALVDEFTLSDEAEPAPIYRA